jgi:hypothetical protein
LRSAPHPPDRGEAVKELADYQRLTAEGKLGVLCSSLVKP